MEDRVAHKLANKKRLFLGHSCKPDFITYIFIHWRYAIDRIG